MTPTGPPNGCIRVATYNVHDLLDDRAAAARVVRRIDPDVLCLQEVPRRLLGAWSAASFARACRMYWSGHHRGSGGTTVLTSLRVQARQSRHHRLPVPAFARRRGYAVATVALPGRSPITVASVHLSLDPGERECHAGLILAALAGAGDVVLAGDLNEEAGPAHARITDRYRVVSPAVPTFPSARPEHLLDVIAASRGLEAVPTVAVLPDEADLVAASDHRPIWVDLRSP